MSTNITVVGSYIVGMTMCAAQFPVPGETVVGFNYQQLHGGKGSNQAVGCARLGANVQFITAIGDDSFGRGALALYCKEGVDSSHILVAKKDEAPTGVGFVIVDGNGENIIVIDIGANKLITPDFVDSKWENIKASRLIMTQMEIPLSTVIHLMKRASKEGLSTLLNPAPYNALPAEVWKYIDYATPNETETRQLLGLSLTDKTEPKDLAKELHKLGCKNVILTLGSKGAYVSRYDGKGEFISAEKVIAVDTTGAGDCFASALGVSVAKGASLKEAAEYAVKAAAKCVTKYGVIESLPYMDDMLKHCRHCISRSNLDSSPADF